MENFHFISGLRLSVPVPEQGASTSTQSALPPTTRCNLALSRWNWTFWRPALRILCLACKRMPFLTSWMNICPVLWRKGPNANALPPEPPQ